MNGAADAYIQVAINHLPDTLAIYDEITGFVDDFEKDTIEGFDQCYAALYVTLQRVEERVKEKSPWEIAVLLNEILGLSKKTPEEIDRLHIDARRFAPESEDA
jgi:hypothetical protein